VSAKHVPVSDRSICAFCREPWPCFIATGRDAIVQMVIDIAEGKREGALKRALAKIEHPSPAERQ
jgi:hypothetical protein